MTMTAEEAYAEAERRIEEGKHDLIITIDLSDLKALEDIPEAANREVLFLDLGECPIFCV